MKVVIILRKVAETFVIASLSTLFGYIGAHYFKNDFIIPSVISGLGGVLGLLLLSIPNLVQKKDEEIKKIYGPWTQGMRKECLRYKKKAIISILLSSLIIVVASSVTFYTTTYLIVEYQGKTTEYPLLISFGFLASLFALLDTIFIRLSKYKGYIREYKRYKRACMNNAEGL